MTAPGEFTSWGISGDGDPSIAQGAQPPVVDTDELRRSVADDDEARTLAAAQHVLDLETKAAVPVQGWMEVNELAEQNRADIDSAITRMTDPLVTLFAAELQQHAVRTPKPKHLGTITEIPPLDENPDAWRKYMEKNCVFAPWTPEHRPSEEVFAAGLPRSDGTLDLVGFGRTTKLASGLQRIYWMQVHDGRVVVAYNRFATSSTIFITGTAHDPAKPPTIHSMFKDGRHERRHTAIYDGEQDSFPGTTEYTDKSLLIGLAALADMCEGITPGVETYEAIAHELNDRKHPHPHY